MLWRLLWNLSCVVLLTGGFGSLRAQSLAPVSATAPMTGADRLEWFAKSTAGPRSLGFGLISAGWGTLFNAPKEYGPHWEGFGKRYGIRTTAVATGRAMEAGLGAIWGEDPRYPRAVERPFGARVANIIKMTVMARNDSGRTVPAYARYTATAGSSFLSNAWRADSEATNGHAAQRILTGFLTRMAANALTEFWPDLKRRISKPKDPPRP